MTDQLRVVSGGYGPRYGPFSQFAPQPAPWHGQEGAGGVSWLPADFDPYAVLQAYRERAAAAGAAWAIDQPTNHAEEAS